MNNRNYFKTATGTLHFFNTGNIDSTKEAYDKARLTSHEVSVWRVPFSAGPWDRAQVIGHRRRGEILQDLHNTPLDQIDSDTEEFSIERLSEELKMLDSQYLNAGRVCVPPMAMAIA